MEGSFIDVSLIIVLAAALGVAAHFFRQPSLVAYLITGVVVSAFGVLNLDNKGVLEIMAKFGITFLLFLVGLEMRLSELKTVGKAALLTGLGQIIFTSVIGFGIVRLLGFGIVEGIYIAVALTFSSTIIIIKLLSEKRDLQSLYGRIVVGFLLLQDFVAMVILIVLSGFQQSAEVQINAGEILLILAKMIVLFGGTIILSRKIIPAYVERIARNQELLFITSIAWAFGIALFVSSPLVGFSIEIGGFLAGLALAQSAEQFQINARIRPLRDFFLVIFFIVLGSSLVASDIQSIITPAIILSLFVLIGNPLIVLIIMGILGYRKRTSFFASVTVAQISEFSLILMALGLAIGHVSDRSLTLVTVVGVITIMISTYMVTHSVTLYKILQSVLSIFEKKKHNEQSLKKIVIRDHVILVGAHRLGQNLLKALDPKKTIVVEFDPLIVTQVKAQGYPVIFGDVADPDIIEATDLRRSAVVISSVPSFEDNQQLIKHIQSLPSRKRPFTIVTAHQEWEIKIYYEMGADYVLYPYFVGAQHVSQLFKKGRWNKTAMQIMKQRDLKALAH